MQDQTILQPAQQSASETMSGEIASGPIAPPPYEPRTKYESFPAITAFWLGLILLFFGIVIIILNVVDILLNHLFGFFGQGMLAGIFFFVTGILAIVSSKYKSKCPMIALVILAVFAQLATLPAMIAHTVGAIFPLTADGEDAKWETAMRGVSGSISVMSAIAGIISGVLSVLACINLVTQRPPQQTAMIAVPMVYPSCPSNQVSPTQLHSCHNSEQQPLQQTDNLTEPPPYSQKRTSDS